MLHYSTDSKQKTTQHRLNPECLLVSHWTHDSVLLHPYSCHDWFVTIKMQITLRSLNLCDQQLANKEECMQFWDEKEKFGYVFLTAVWFLLFILPLLPTLLVVNVIWCAYRPMAVNKMLAKSNVQQTGVIPITRYIPSNKTIPRKLDNIKLTNI